MKALVAALMGIPVFAVLFHIAFSQTHQPTLDTTPRKKELLVYCGITMFKPVSEIARIIEAREDCKIIITKGGSGNLLRAIEINRVGDLYLPGSESYIEAARQKGLVTRTSLVGYNQAALMVQKGNPKHISHRLENLADPAYYVVIGDPQSGSIGRETKKILMERGIFEAVSQNAKELTTDSKNLVRVLKDREADLVVNWRATATWPENAPYMDALEILETSASQNRLVMGMLACSRHPGIAEKFLHFAASAPGQAIFRKYGFYDAK